MKKVLLLRQIPNSFLDFLSQYAAAVELGGGKAGSPYASIAEKLRQKVRDLFRENADDWISIQFKNQKKRLREWIAEFDPSKANSLFKTKVRLCLADNVRILLRY